jgi:3-oxoacyl-[acyl-carrier protein] reductase
LAREGARVALASRRAEDLHRVRDELAACGLPDALVVPTDMADEAAVVRLAQAVGVAFGRLDILVNNAGVALSAPVTETSAQDWDRLMAVNARGPFLLCREAIPLLSRSRGLIFNVASVVGVKGYANQAAYTASKHALMGFTKVLAQEVKPLGIRVHAICPGGVATDMVRQMRPDIDAAQLIQPEEIADLIVFLATRKGNAVIDQVNLRRAASDPWF